jgi:hypothetical protein
VRDDLRGKSAGLRHDAPDEPRLDHRQHLAEVVGPFRPRDLNQDRGRTGAVRRSRPRLIRR